MEEEKAHQKWQGEEEEKNWKEWKKRKEKRSTVHKAGKNRQRRNNSSHQVLIYDFSLGSKWDSQAQRWITRCKKCNSSKKNTNSAVFHITSIFLLLLFRLTAQICIIRNATEPIVEEQNINGVSTYLVFCVLDEHHQNTSMPDEYKYTVDPLTELLWFC